MTDNPEPPDTTTNENVTYIRNSNPQMAAYLRRVADRLERGQIRGVLFVVVDDNYEHDSAYLVDKYGVGTLLGIVSLHLHRLKDRIIAEWEIP